MTGGGFTRTLGRVDLPRAHDFGWCRSWPFGQPHYYERGATRALCGSITSSTYPINQHLSATPDGNRPESERKEACPHCLKLLKAGKAGHSDA